MKRGCVRLSQLDQASIEVKLDAEFHWMGEAFSVGAEPLVALLGVHLRGAFPILVLLPAVQSPISL